MEHSASSTAALAPNADVVARRMGAGVVLVHLATNRIFELNDTGARIWELINERVSEGRIVDALVREFNVGREQAGMELARVIGELRGEGLLLP